jgi:hypothetical protein
MTTIAVINAGVSGPSSTRLLADRGAPGRHRGRHRGGTPVRAARGPREQAPLVPVKKTPVRVMPVRRSG